MLTYDKLTKSQKKWVDTIATVYPKLANGGTISLKECWSAAMKLKAERSNGGVKVGYPNWLFKTNKISSGVYFFPANGANPEQYVKQAQATKLQSSLASKPTQAINSKEDEEFFAELAENGIDVKTSATVAA